MEILLIFFLLVVEQVVDLNTVVVVVPAVGQQKLHILFQVFLLHM
jgi:hypothetical protein